MSNVDHLPMTENTTNMTIKVKTFDAQTQKYGRSDKDLIVKYKLYSNGSIRDITAIDKNGAEHEFTGMDFVECCSNLSNLHRR